MLNNNSMGMGGNSPNLMGGGGKSSTQVTIPKDVSVPPAV